MSAQLEAIKAELQKAKDLGTPIRDDLYQHLTEVFNRITLHHQKDCFDRFETISALVKRNNFKIQDLPSDKQVNGCKREVTNQQAQDMIKKAQDLINGVCDQQK